MLATTTINQDLAHYQAADAPDHHLLGDWSAQQHLWCRQVAAWNAPYNGQKIDKCVVYDVTFSGATYPATPTLSLDAAKLTLSGPGLAGSVVPEINTPGSIGPIYSLQLSSGTLVGGGRYQLNAAGGPQVQAFNASATLPANFTTNASSINNIVRTNPVPTTRTGTGFDNIIITAQSTAVSAAGTHQVMITCVVPASLGSYTVPSAALMNLPTASVGHNSDNFFSVEHQHSLTPTLVVEGKRITATSGRSIRSPSNGHGINQQLCRLLEEGA